MKLLFHLLFFLSAFTLYILIDLNYKLPPSKRLPNPFTTKQNRRYDIMKVRGLAIHHSGSAIRLPHTDQVIDAAYIDRWHKFRKFRRFKFGKVYHIGYHYVILHTGKIESGRPEHYPGGHLWGWPNYSYLGICLVGNFEKKAKHDYYYYINRPTKSQWRSLMQLMLRLQIKYGFSIKKIHPHRYFNLKSTCPGTNFNWEKFKKRYKKFLRGYFPQKQHSFILNFFPKES